MKNLSNEELLQCVWAEHNPLTTTELETELANRFQALIDEHAELPDYREVIEEFEDVTTDKLRAALQLTADWLNARELLDVLNDFDYDNADVLRGKLARLQQFDQVMEDLREPLQSLTNLATTE